MEDYSPARVVPDFDIVEERTTDGYGFPFPAWKQHKHLQYILDAEAAHQIEMQKPLPPPVEPEWKELPAGYRLQESKGSGT
jgi:hypothetical protein